jgi:hypothetical protein
MHVPLTCHPERRDAVREANDVAKSKTLFRTHFRVGLRVILSARDAVREASGMAESKDPYFRHTFSVE